MMADEIERLNQVLNKGAQIDSLFSQQHWVQFAVVQNFLWNVTYDVAQQVRPPHVTRNCVC